MTPQAKQNKWRADQTWREPTGSRPGLTVLELLVVLAILGTLLGLLLPAVQKARRSVNRLSCQNNLRQLAIACLSFHDQNNGLPHGGYGNAYPPTYLSPGNPAIGSAQLGGPFFQILPEIEGSAAWRGGGQPTIADCQQVAMSTPNKLFFCPARPGPKPRLVNGWAMTDYVANGGVICCFGVMTRIETIQDGSSNTIMLGEKRLNLWHLGEWMADDNEGYCASCDQDTVRDTDRPPAPDFNSLSPPAPPDGEKKFGSSHQGVFSVAFVDGHVQIISYSINYVTWRQLGLPNDGGPLSNDY